jgi:hypothetical protein
MEMLACAEQEGADVCSLLVAQAGVRTEHLHPQRRTSFHKESSLFPPGIKAAPSPRASLGNGSSAGTAAPGARR